MLLPNTPETRTLWRSVRSRIGAEKHWLRAQMVREILIGLGALSLMFGLGAGVALIGYSYLLDRRPTVAEMARAFATALAGAGVRPSAAQLGMTGMPRSGAPVVTNYTVFKSTAYGKGEVVTGWNYDSSDNPAPVRQYCYYRESGGDDLSVDYQFAIDGRLLPAMDHSPVEVADAARNCVWFDGRPTARPG